MLGRPKTRLIPFMVSVGNVFGEIEISSNIPWALCGAVPWLLVEIQKAKEVKLDGKIFCIMWCLGITAWLGYRIFKGFVYNMLLKNGYIGKINNIYSVQDGQLRKIIWSFDALDGRKGDGNGYLPFFAGAPGLKNGVNLERWLELPGSIKYEGDAVLVLYLPN